MKIVNAKLSIVALILLVLITAGCTDTPEESTPEYINIGLVAPLSGGASDVGNDMKQAAVLAV